MNARSPLFSSKRKPARLLAFFIRQTAGIDDSQYLSQGHHKPAGSIRS